MMSLSIERSVERSEEQQPTAGLVADRRLYLTADKDRVVEEGDPSAAFLLAPEGTEIPADDVRRLGLVTIDGKITNAAPAAVDAAVPPAVEAVPPAPARSGSRRGGR